MDAKRSDARGPGAGGFTRQYWADTYDAPETMDGIYNATRQAAALKAQFDAEYVEIGSLFDFGFGLGYLFRAMINAFIPHTVVGIEPSPHAFALMQNDRLSDVSTTDVTLLPTDLFTWCHHGERAEVEPLDLGICTSVFQYLSDPELVAVVPLLAQRVKYLYLTVPTDEELEYQSRELDLDDRYAFSRTREEYRDLLREHFAIISNRLLESKVHFDVETSSFNDLLFRFD
jgi:hypothetical protein